MTRLHWYYLSFPAWILLMFIVAPYVSGVRGSILVLWTAIHTFAIAIPLIDSSVRRDLKKFLGDE